MRRLRVEFDQASIFAVAVTALAVATLIFGDYLFPHTSHVGFDEGYMVSFAERMLDHRGLPYVDSVSQRGPVLYWVIAAAQLVFGRFEWVGIRVVGLIACLLTIAATFLAGVAARRPLAGAVGAAAPVLVVAIAGRTIGVHGESVAMPFLAISFCLVSYGLYRQRGGRRVALLAGAGAFAALAAMTKQTSGIVAVPLFVWIVAHTSLLEAPEGARLARLRPALWFAGGWAVIMGGIVSLYAARGALDALVYWTVTYNGEIYMGPYRGHYWRELHYWLGKHLYVLAAPILGAAFVVAVPVAAAEVRSPRGIARACAERGFELCAAWTALSLFAVGVLPLRFWWHYFMPVWPFAGIMVGALLERLAQRFPKRTPIVAALLVALIAATGGHRVFAIHARRVSSGAAKGPRPDRICQQIDANAPKGESVFIWGFAGDLYITCRRKPATRFTYLTLVAGIVPPFWKNAHPSRAARGAVEQLLSDLEQERPRLIVDVPLRGYFPMTRVPQLAELLERDYCPLSVVTGRGKRRAVLYGRRDAMTCPEVPTVPPPAAEVDPGPDHEPDPSEVEEPGQHE